MNGAPVFPLSAMLNIWFRIVGQGTSGSRLQSPILLMMSCIVSYQIGIALSKGAVGQISAPAVSFLRLAFGGIILFLVYKPRLRGLDKGQWALVTGMGGANAAMSVLFFLALESIPIGFATAVTFGGPCILALSGTRRLSQLFWVIVATGGIALLAPWGQGASASMGFIFAAMAGASYSAYIVLTKRAGQRLPSSDALPLAMVLGALVIAPVGLSSASTTWLDPKVLVVLALASLLSTVVPNMLEFLILTRVPASHFAILVTLDPAVASIVGFALLAESLGPLGLIAILMITAGSLFASQAQDSPTAKILIPERSVAKATV